MEYKYLTERFGDSRPTSFDRSHGSFAGAQEHIDWYTVLTQNRDSGALDKSNFQVATDWLKAHGEDAYTIHRFGHWGCGWYEVLVVNSTNADACNEAEKLLSALDGYPVLDDMHHSAMMCEQEECECECCPKSWCDCASCVEHFKDAYGDIVL